MTGHRNPLAAWFLGVAGMIMQQNAQYNMAHATRVSNRDRTPGKPGKAGDKLARRISKGNFTVRHGFSVNTR